MGAILISNSGLAAGDASVFSRLSGQRQSWLLVESKKIQGFPRGHQVSGAMAEMCGGKDKETQAWRLYE